MHPKDISIAEYNYPLPDDRIARYPVNPRDSARLLVYAHGNITDHTYTQLAQQLPAKTLLVGNQTRVIHARLLFTTATGSTIELFCLEPHRCYADVPTAMLQKGCVMWICLVGGAKKWKPGKLLSAEFAEHNFTLTATMEARVDGAFVIQLEWTDTEMTFAEVLHHAGKIPLPPYLGRAATADDEETYQTIFARNEGSVAAPTAGLHFTAAVLQQLADNAIDIDYVTLHVGAGTFMPVKSETMDGHNMHAEWIEVDSSFIGRLLQQGNHPIFPIGTTSLRTLESLYHIGNKLVQGMHIDWAGYAVKQWDPYETMAFCTFHEAMVAVQQWMQQQNTNKLVARTQILIAPGYTFRVASGLLTNFHQPQSTLLLLVAALIGNDWTKVYQYALDNDFRFLSYGDGSLLWKMDPLP